MQKHANEATRLLLAPRSPRHTGSACASRTPVTPTGSMGHAADNSWRAAAVPPASEPHYGTTRFPSHPSSSRTPWWRKLTFELFGDHQKVESLREQDVWPLQPRLQSATTANELRAAYAAHGSNLLAALFAMNARHLWLGGVLQLGSMLCKIWRPLLFLSVLNAAASGSEQGDAQSPVEVCLRLLLMYVVELVGCLCACHANARSELVKMRIIGALHSLLFDGIMWANEASGTHKSIYRGGGDYRDDDDGGVGGGAHSRQVLSMAPSDTAYEPAKGSPTSASQRQRLAEVADMCGTDVNTVANAVSSLHDYWDCSLQIVVCILIPILELNVPWRIVVGVLVCFSGTLLVEMMVGARLMQQVRAAVTFRVNTLHECIKGIQMIKLNAWEDKMERKISEAMHAEMAADQYAMVFDAIRTQISGEAASVVAAITFAIAGTELLRPRVVFTILIVFRQLRFQMVSFCGLFDGVMRARISLRRIQCYAHFDPEPDIDLSVGSNARDAAPEGFPDRDGLDHDKTATNPIAVRLTQVTVSCPPTLSRVLLVNVNLRIRTGELVLIRGPSGSGKSTLLAMMRGYKPGLIHGSVFVAAQQQSRVVDGKSSCHSRIAYCAQEPWLQSLTIRHNVVFGSKFEEGKYWSVLDACGLLEDVSRLPSGDATLVGPKGINLSGGQKARIALARACYADAELYLLDSPFSNVDAVVQGEVFRKCIVGILRNKTVVIVAHNTEIIGSHCVDQVVTVERLCVSSTACSSKTSGIHKSTASTKWRSHRSQLTLDETARPWRQSEPVTHDRQGGSGTCLSENLHFEPMSTASCALVDLVKRSRGGARSHTASSETSTSASYGETLARGSFSGMHTVGMVTSATVRNILNHSESVLPLRLGVVILLVWRVFTITKDVWMKDWANNGGVNDIQAKPKNPISEWLWSQPATVYAFLVVTCACLGVIARIVYSAAFDRVSERLVGGMVQSLLKAPMNFFYATPIGEVMNHSFPDARFVSRVMPRWSWVLIASAMSVIGQLALIGYYLGPFAFLVLAGIISAMITQITSFQFYVRLVQVGFHVDTRMLNYISEAIDGGDAVARALGESHSLRFRHEHGVIVDQFVRLIFFTTVFNKSVMMRTAYASSALFLLTIPMLTTANQDPGEVALVMYYVASVHIEVIALSTGLIYTLCALHSAERLREFGEITPERDVSGMMARRLSRGGNSSPLRDGELDSWPLRGDIVFDNVHFGYGTEDCCGAGDQGSSNGQPYASESVLRNVSFAIRGGSRVGVLGRTGSGKSSLAMALVRIHPLVLGRISVDGIDVALLSLQRLRRSITVIPQTPLFYRCTVREYLDPFGDFEGKDASLMRQIRAVGLNRNGQSLSLDDALWDNGENWSLGERQMLCFARAMLKPSRVLVLDESLSALDPHKAATVLDYGLRTSFLNSTVLLITHHLDQILGFDSLLVMDKGELAEVGTAAELAANPDSLFYEFLETTLLST